MAGMSIQRGIRGSREGVFGDACWAELGACFFGGVQLSVVGCQLLVDVCEVGGAWFGVQPNR